MSALHMTRNTLVAFARFLVGARAHWAGCPECPTHPVQRVYFSNHTSHLDSLTLWAALPTALRTQTRPVAAKDYWGKGGVKTFIADRGLRAFWVCCWSQASSAGFWTENTSTAPSMTSSSTSTSAFAPGG